MICAELKKGDKKDKICFQNHQWQFVKVEIFLPTKYWHRKTKVAWGNTS